MRHTLLGLDISRFALVGCVNTVIDFSLFMLLAHLPHVPLAAANVLSWMAAFSFSYVVNGRWTFGLGWDRLLQPAYAARLVLANAASVLTTTAIVLLAAPRIGIAPAKILAIAVGFVLNYALAKRAAARP